MCELGIDGNADVLRVYRIKFFKATLEGDNFRWTYEREVQRIEEQHDILDATKLRKGEIFDKVAAVHHSVRAEVRGGFTY